MVYRGNDRWQFQPWYVKVYRWVKYLLPSMPRAYFYYWKARLGLIQPTTDHEEFVFGQNKRLWAKHNYALVMANAQCSAGHIYTTDEMKEMIKARHDAEHPPD